MAFSFLWIYACIFNNLWLVTDELGCTCYDIWRGICLPNVSQSCSLLSGTATCTSASFAKGDFRRCWKQMLLFRHRRQLGYMNIDFWVTGVKSRIFFLKLWLTHRTYRDMTSPTGHQISYIAYTSASLSEFMIKYQNVIYSISVLHQQRFHKHEPIKLISSSSHNRE